MADDQKFQIFRAADALDFMHSEVQTQAAPTPVQAAGGAKLMEAGAMDGAELNLLVNIPGFSLLNIWFKSNYPLILHSHDSDCLYYIIAGSIQMGNETLGPRDSFFVPATARYSYQAGEDGVELLEIRQVNSWDFKNYATTEGWYDKAAAIVEANHQTWLRAKRPALNATDGTQ